MVKQQGVVERDRLLRSLKGRRFERIRFPGADAVVVRVPDDAAIPPPSVLDMLNRKRPMRIFPVGDGAHLVKWLHIGDETLPEGHSLEAGGWDHLHCSACNRHILAGRTFWQTAFGSCFHLCPYCYRRLHQLR